MPRRGHCPSRYSPMITPILADLGVPVLLGQGEAEVPRPVGIGGIVLPGSGGADHVKAGHLVRVVWYVAIVGGQLGISGDWWTAT